jgi:hypothetical protein
MQVDGGYRMGGTRRVVRALRWVLVAVSLALAAVLLFRHRYILGLLIGGLVALRVAILLATSRRRRPGSAAQGTYVAAPGPLGAAGTRGRPLAWLARSEFLVAAGVIGMDPAQIRTSYEQGSSLAEIAARAGVPTERIVDAVVSDAGAKIDDALARGTFDARRAGRLKTRLPIWAGRLVNHHKRDLQQTW